MIVKILKFLVLVFLIVLSVLILRDDFRSYLKDELFRRGIFVKIRQLEIPIKEIKTEIKKASGGFPKPLVSELNDYTKEGELKSDKIVLETNLRRDKDGLSELLPNMALQLAAENKVNDMFTNQYFEHDSPQGLGPADFASGAGYFFLLVGENLALGIFKDESDLVDAWMNSPGHRANILSSKFTEIGVSAKRGLYKGDMVWMAVQEFGKPLSTCPMPAESEKTSIENYSKLAKDFAQNLEKLRVEIENSPKNDPKYNQMVNSYNTLVKEYNSIIKELEVMSKLYNEKADKFNQCVKEETT